MAKIVENENENKFPNSRIGKSQFLTSVRDWNKDGVKLGVERVSRVFPVKQDVEKAQLTVEFVIMSDMKKCRMFELDNDGEYVTQMDELTGKEERTIVIEEVKADDLVTFPMFLPCGKPKEITNDADLTFYPSSSAYPLFKLALQENESLPRNMGNKAFSTTQEELKEALEGFEFIAKCEEVKGKFNYIRMVCELE